MPSTTRSVLHLHLHPSPPMEREFLLTYKDIDVITGSGKQKHLLIEQEIARLFLCVFQDMKALKKKNNKLIV